MFGIKKILRRIKELEAEIEQLKKDKINEIYYGEHTMSPYTWGRSRKSISVDSAVDLIIDHLGLKITETPSKKAIVKLEKIKGGKK